MFTHMFCRLVKSKLVKGHCSLVSRRAMTMVVKKHEFSFLLNLYKIHILQVHKIRSDLNYLNYTIALIHKIDNRMRKLKSLIIKKENEV